MPNECKYQNTSGMHKTQILQKRLIKAPKACVGEGFTHLGTPLPPEAGLGTFPLLACGPPLMAATQAPSVRHNGRAAWKHHSSPFAPAWGSFWHRVPGVAGGIVSGWRGFTGFAWRVLLLWHQESCPQNYFTPEGSGKRQVHFSRKAHLPELKIHKL